MIFRFRPCRGKVRTAKNPAAAGFFAPLPCPSPPFRIRYAGLRNGIKFFQNNPVIFPFSSSSGQSPHRYKSCCGRIFRFASLPLLSVSHPLCWAAKRYQVLSEQSCDFSVFVHVDLFGGRYFRQARHGTPRDKSRGDPCDLTQIVRSEFGRFQGFA